jgi:hypothetical protein
MDQMSRKYTITGGIHSAKVTFKLVRSFGLGVLMHSPTLNGLSVELYLGCFSVAVWSRGMKLLAFRNYWKG